MITARISTAVITNSRTWSFMFSSVAFESGVRHMIQVAMFNRRQTKVGAAAGDSYKCLIFARDFSKLHAQKAALANRSPDVSEHSIADVRGGGNTGELSG